MASTSPIPSMAPDAIQPGQAVRVHAHHGNRSPQSSTDEASPTVYEKKSVSVAPFDIDSESQTNAVGSVQRGDAEMNRWQRGKHIAWLWIKRAWLVVFFLGMTAWWIHGLIKYRNTDNMGWLKPSFVYLCVCMRYFFWLVPSRMVMKPIRFAWQNTVGVAYNHTPERARLPIAAAGTIALFLFGALIPPETGDNTRANRAISLLGLAVMIAVLAASSKNFKQIPWHTVIAGMLSQFLLAVFVLRTSVGYDLFAFISEMARTLLAFAKQGFAFLTAPGVENTPWFMIAVVPAIIFFIALVAALYHVGFLQWFIGKFAVFFFWSLGVSGAEAVVATATPFIGQGESSMMIRPFIPHLTMAEIHQIMTCGFATIAGSTLVAYIGLGLNPQALVSSCIMSIPASIAISKLRYPETEHPLTAGNVEVPKDEEDTAVNWLHALTNGSWLGIKIGATIVACLLTVIALVAGIDGVLGWWGTYWGIGVGGTMRLSLKFIFGYLLYIPTFLLGVPSRDVLKVARIIGQKIVANEFAAFMMLQSEFEQAFGTPDAFSLRSYFIATYACCGFGNLSSLGVQIGIYTQLAPTRGGDVTRVGTSALLCGITATLSSAAVAGMLFHDGMIPKEFLDSIAANAAKHAAVVL